MKRTLSVVLAVVVLVAVIGGGYYGYTYLDGTVNYVSTDNAQVVGQSVAVGSMNAGRVASIAVDVGSRVQANDVLAQIELPTAVRSSQNGTVELEFLGESDQRVDVKAPIGGIVLAVPGAVGQTVGQGLPLVTLLDTSKVWVNANVNENQIAKVHSGQQVEVAIPAVGKSFTGRVRTITPATAASFLPAPATNATADFTQVDQMIPVKIDLDAPSTTLYPGASAVVTIRVASQFP